MEKTAENHQEAGPSFVQSPKRRKTERKDEQGTRTKRTSVDDTNARPQPESSMGRSSIHNNSTPVTDLSVAITTNNRSNLTDQEMTIILTKIDKMMQEQACSGDYVPVFLNITWDNGVITLICSSEDSKLWLRHKLSDIRNNNISQAKLPLKLVQEKDIIKMIKCKIQLPPYSLQTRILIGLKNQNPWAEVDKWKFYKFNKGDSHNELIVEVPSDLLPKILERDSLQFGMNPVKLIVVREQEQEHKPSSNVNDEAGSSAVLNDSASDFQEAGPSGIQSQHERQRESSRCVNNDRNGRASSVLPPKEPGPERATQQNNRAYSEELTRRPLTEYEIGVADLTKFIFCQYHINKKQSFPDFVTQKCILAEKVLGLKVSEQHLVIATLLNLPYIKIKSDLLRRPPKTMKELKDVLDNYPWCEMCGKIGHTRQGCWRNRY